jgi:mercuric ion transport protein
MQDKAPLTDRQSALLGSAQRTPLGEILSAYAGLFTSFATLFCCALPALLVLLGLSVTTVDVFFTAIPGRQDFGAYELWLFPLSGILLAIGFYFAYFRRGSSQGEVCEIPAEGHESACSTATRWNRRILWLSLFLYGLALAMNFWGITWMRTHGYFNR